MNKRFTFLLTCLLLLLLVVPLSAQDAPTSTADGVLIAPTMIIDDFEGGLFSSTAPDGAGIGIVPWGDTAENVALSARLLVPFSEIGIPVSLDRPNSVLMAQYDITGWGGFTHALTDGSEWISEDWTAYNALSLWLFGVNTGGIVQVEIFDNRNPDMAGDTAERYFYRITDDYEGWRQYTIPFAMFQRRTDFQPAGAPNDGFGLDAVSGYAVGLPVNAGAQTIFIDDVGLTTVEDTAAVNIFAVKRRLVQIDRSIGWDTREWELIWSDEFEGDAGTAINADNWTCEVGGHGWGNNELEYYTERPENVSLDGDGNLSIVAREENPDNYECHYGTCTHTSARCITMDKVEFTYGRVEARIKIPRGQGIWPAFWMLGANFSEVGWPTSGEIDIMENVGFEPRIVHGTLHGPGYSGANGVGGSYTGSADFADDFHVYAVDWDPDVIRWYVEGELYNTISANDINRSQWVFDHDFFLLLNVAVGGNWPGYPDETTEFPQEMKVDYVRVYALSE